MSRSRKPSPGGRSKPKIYVTHTGGRYVKAEELLRSPEVKDAIDTMAQIAEQDRNEAASAEPPADE